MSLFGDPLYQWRETFLVLFQKEQRPRIEIVQQALEGIGDFDFEERSVSEEGLFESLTITSEVDLVGMEILYVEGEEVQEEVESLTSQIIEDDLLSPEEGQLQRVTRATARFDILHFERLTGSSGDADDDEEYLDPGSLLAVAAELANIVDGVAMDPGSGTFI